MLKRFLTLPLSLLILTGIIAPCDASSQPISKNGEKESGPQSLSKREHANQSYQKALKLKENGDTGGALLELIKAVNSNPQMVEAYYQQACIFKEQKLLTLAASRLDQALAIDPTFKKARILSATIAIEQGNVGKAFEQLGKSLEKDEAQIAHTGDNTTVLNEIHKNIVPSTSANQEVLKTAKSLNTKPRNFSKGKDNKRRTDKKISRKKIRTLIAKRYKKFHKTYKNPRQNKPWYTRYTKYTKMFAWASAPFKPYKEQNNSQSASLLESKEDRDLVTRASETSQAKAKELLAVAKSLQNPVDSLEARKQDQAVDTIFQSAKVNAVDLVAPAMDLADILTPEASLEQAETEVAAQKKTKSESPNVAFVQPTFQNQKAKLKYIPEITSAKNVVAPKVTKEKFVPPIQDKWTEKLAYLNENGTSSLKQGEAFMFSEDTGEAVLFLKDGSRIRRIITPKQNAEKIVKLRRPDVLVPKDLFIDLSLLGKVVNNKKQPTRIEERPVVAPNKIAGTNDETPPTFHMEKLLDESRTFVGAIRDALRL